MSFLAFTNKVEHLGEPSYSWTIGIYETLGAAKRETRKYCTKTPTDPLQRQFPPRVVIQQWSGSRKLRQFERTAGNKTWVEVIPF